MLLLLGYSCNVIIDMLWLPHCCLLLDDTLPEMEDLKCEKVRTDVMRGFRVNQVSVKEWLHVQTLRKTRRPLNELLIFT